MENENLSGGWTPRRPLTEEDLKVFEEATQGLVGAKYTPLEVSTQVVAGTNYRFDCMVELATVEPVKYNVEVIVFKPLPGNGEAVITAITPQAGECEKAMAKKTFCVKIPAGPLWSNDDAQKRGPYICAAHGGRFTGQWYTAVWGKMSVVECEFTCPQGGNGISFTLDVPAGPLWSNEDAKEKCDAICASYGGKWNGQWTTIIPNKMSVCGCEFNW